MIPRRLLLSVATAFLTGISSLPAQQAPIKKFDPAVMAASETKQWQAYYRYDLPLIQRELAALLTEQFGLSAQDASAISQSFYQAAAAFAMSQSDYEKNVLPPLVQGYGDLKKAVGGAWDPEKAARAELAWWVARRRPGENSPENVGRLIAALYTELYGKENENIQKAGLLRAQAAYKRAVEAAAGTPDWKEINRLLEESYSSLKAGIE